MARTHALFFLRPFAARLPFLAERCSPPTGKMGPRVHWSSGTSPIQDEQSISQVGRILTATAIPAFFSPLFFFMMFTPAKL